MGHTGWSSTHHRHPSNKSNPSLHPLAAQVLCQECNKAKSSRAIIVENPEVQVPCPHLRNKLALQAQIAELQAEKAVLKARLENINLLTEAVHGRGRGCP